MRQRICTLALSFLLLFSAISDPARAAEAFAPVRTYDESFVDVSIEDWYYSAVKALYQLGLTGGKGRPDTFAPEDDISVGEVAALAARLRSLYETGDSEAGSAPFSGGSSWYGAYVSYLQALEVIGGELEGRFDFPATRAEMAHILAGALPGEWLSPINEEAVTAGFARGLYIQDVAEDDSYCQDILRLYTWGILSGTDEAGSFLPGRTVSRCEAAAMVARLACPELRLTLDWEIPPVYSRQGTSMTDLVFSSGDFYEAPAPDDAEKIDADVRYMLSRGERQLTFRYEPGVLTGEMANDLTRAFVYGARQYVEQTYNYVHCTHIKSTGYLSLEFSSSLYGAGEIDRYRQETMDYAIAVHDRLWEEGAIHEGMTEYEKAKVYFTWICDNCRYDFSSNDSSMSHSGWRLFAEGLAVCDGYTAAYNLLLKLEGISCGTCSTAKHIWTTAELDGQTYHIDTTWGDQKGQIAYNYFAMTEEESLARF